MVIIYSTWDKEVPVEKTVRFGAISLAKQSMPTLLAKSLVLPWWEQNPSFSKVFFMSAGILLGGNHRNFENIKICQEALQILPTEALEVRIWDSWAPSAGQQQQGPIRWKQAGQVFLGGSLMRSLPAKAEDMSLIPDPGRSHMPQGNWASAPQLLSLCSRAWQLQGLKPVCPRACAPRQKKSPPQLESSPC